MRGERKVQLAAVRIPAHVGAPVMYVTVDTFA